METSITIDGLRCFIDSGVFNDAKYDYDTGVTTTEETQITKAMQLQRSGRVGRLSPGISVQITYAELEDSITPEILKANLQQVYLSMKRLGISSWPIWSKNYTIPKDAYVFSIKKDELNKIITGCLVHIIGFELFPEHRRVPDELNNPFGKALIQGYLNSVPNLFTPFNDKIIDFENADLVFISKSKNNDSNQAIEKAFKSCQKLIMYTPRSILMRGINPYCHCEMIVTGFNNKYL